MSWMTRPGLTYIAMFKLTREKTCRRALVALDPDEQDIIDEYRKSPLRQRHIIANVLKRYCASIVHQPDAFDLLPPHAESLQSGAVRSCDRRSAQG